MRGRVDPVIADRANDGETVNSRTPNTPGSSSVIAGRCWKCRRIALSRVIRFESARVKQTELKVAGGKNGARRLRISEGTGWQLCFACSLACRIACTSLTNIRSCPIDVVPVATLLNGRKGQQRNCSARKTKTALTGRSLFPFARCAFETCNEHAAIYRVHRAGTRII